MDLEYFLGCGRWLRSVWRSCFLEFMAVSFISLTVADSSFIKEAGAQAFRSNIRVSPSLPFAEILLGSLSVLVPEGIEPSRAMTLVSSTFSPVPPIGAVTSAPSVTTIWRPVCFFVSCVYVSLTDLTLLLPSTTTALASLSSRREPSAPEVPSFLLEELLVSSKILPSFFVVWEATSKSVLPILIPVVSPSDKMEPVSMSVRLPCLATMVRRPFPE